MLGSRLKWSWGGVVVVAALGAVLGHLIWLADAPGSRMRVLRETLGELRGGRSVPANPVLDWTRQAARGGHIVLRFSGFDVKKANEGLRVSSMYQMVVYDLYPQRAFVGESKDAPNTGDGIVARPFTPTMEWMAAHDVRAVVTIRRESGGEISVNEQPLREGGGLAVQGAGSRGWIGFYFGVVLLVGYATVCVVCRGERMGWALLVGLSGLGGAGMVGMLLFGASLAGFVPGRGVMGGMGVGAMAVMGMCGMKWGVVKPVGAGGREGRATGWVLVVVGGFVGYLMVLLVAGSMQLPLMEWDSWAIWFLKAKVVAHEALWPRPGYFGDSALVYSHPRYPLLLPMLIGGIWGAVGSIDDHVGRLVPAFLYGSFVLLAYGGLRWRVSRLVAGLLTGLVAGLPVLTKWATSGLADGPVMYLHFGGVLFLVKWIAERKRADLIFAILFAAFTAFCKDEGLAMAGVSGGVMGVVALWRRGRREWVGLGGFALGVGVLLLPWWVWSAGVGRYDEDYAGQVTGSRVVENVSRLGVILPAVGREMVDWENWGGIWILLGVAAGLGWRAFRGRVAGGLWLLLAGHLGVYVLIYMVTPWDLSLLLSFTLDRVLLHLMPEVVLLVAVHAGAVIHVSNNVVAPSTPEPCGGIEV